MIKKWVEVTCDCEECRSAIGHYLAGTIKSIVEFVKKDGAIVRYISGKRQPLTFCSEERYKNYLKEQTNEK